MIIGSSQVQMDSAHSYQAKQTSISQVTIGNETQTIAHEAAVSRQEGSTRLLGFTDMLKSEMIDDATAEMEQSMLGMKSSAAKADRVMSLDDISNYRQIQQETMLYLIRYLRQILMNHIFGDTISSDGYTDQLQSGSGSNANGLQFGQGQTDNIMGYNARGNLIRQSTYYSSYEEMEQTAFETKGKVVTADGKEIEFNVEMQMTRSFQEAYLEQNEVYGEVGTNLVDPLVINLNSGTAKVSDQKFLFDLDSDGILDNVSALDSGSGFLALDQNEDGVINDGSELFGTKSGNGFADLAGYDEDGNGWIDEADSVFSKLLIWTKNANGEDELYHLKDAGVGAICLENVSTDFSLKSLKDNTLNGAIRQTGIFLYENGGVGTVQHLDLAT